MANPYWIGGATAVAQVDTFVPANVEIGDVFTLTATGENSSIAAITFTATAATVANVAAGLVAAWNASTNALHTGVTASGGTTNVVLTADTAGIPFHVTSSTTDGGGTNSQTLSRTATTANSGPKDWNCAANWSTGSVPANDDSIFFNGNGGNDAIYGLVQSGVTPANLYIDFSFGYSIGTTSAPLNLAGITGVVRIGEPSGDGSTGGGSPLINLKIGGAFVVQMKNSRTTGTSGLCPVNIAGGTGTSIYQNGGILGYCMALPGDTGTLTVADVTSRATLKVGSGAVWSGTITNTSANVFTYGGGSSATLSHTGGNSTAAGTAKIAAVTAYAGTVKLNNRPGSGNAVDTLTVSGATVEWKENPAAFTGGTLSYGSGVLSVASPSQLTFSVGQPTFGTNTRLSLGGSIS